MLTLNERIAQAISNGETSLARELLREAIKEPTAETYYLASQVAIDSAQSREFLEKAVELDPFHEKAVTKLRGSAHSPSSTITKSASGFSIGNLVIVVCTIAIGIAFTTMPWVNLFGIKYSGLRLLTETNLSSQNSLSALWLIPVAAIAAGVAWIIDIAELGTQLATRMLAFFAGVVGIVYFSTFFFQNLESLIDITSFVDFGFWIALTASLILIIQVFIPEPGVAKSVLHTSQSSSENSITATNPAAKKLYNKAIDAFLKGRYQTSLEYLDKAIEIEPRGRGYFMRAKCYQRLGNAAKADENLQLYQQFSLSQSGHSST
jgi:tetratricopeptide (TPR) repeat protein